MVDPDVTGEAVKDAVLRDQGYGMRAVYLSLAKLDDRLPVFAKYLTLDAARTWSDSIAWGRKFRRSVTGTVRFYDRRVQVANATSAGIAFCEDQSQSYDKDADTGEVFGTKPSLDDFVFHTARMVKSADGTWQMANYKSQKAAAQCRQ
ncbi:hypothetical protein [Actinacidiphila acidipaludis]|uniref:SnoaL-like domain-containing protein n=1 Tax=Actinacidiphila acidipaludis TaxID=2873382 RepID=A0ABS7QBZ9_9ACTN|nr:hypothetical protein [Streptomyces acidipaludis]MBY8879314.1 hypothetical protein [Streptomyces acidipaludis]